MKWSSDQLDKLYEAWFSHDVSDGRMAEFVGRTEIACRKKAAKEGWGPRPYHQKRRDLSLSGNWRRVSAARAQEAFGRKISND